MSCAWFESTCPSLRPTCSMPNAVQFSPHGVAAHQAERDELVNRSPLIDDEVAADVRQLVQLGIGVVGREGVEGGVERVVVGVVDDDDLRVAQLEGVQAVVALGVGPHLRLALGAERDRVVGDRRLRRHGRRGQQREDHVSDA